MEHEQEKNIDINELVSNKDDSEQKQEPIKPKTTKPRRKIDYWKLSSIAFFILLIISIYTQGFSNIDLTGFAAQSTYSGDKVKLDFYVMSQCPYGTQVEDAVKPILDKMPEIIDFRLEFIANEEEDGTFTSLHGEPEVLGNIVQLCAQKQDSVNFMDMVFCMNQDAINIPDNWEQCATQNNLDLDKIKMCYEGDEGKALLSESIKKADEVKAASSPTMFMNDEPFNKRKTNDMMRAICEVIDNKHQECKNLPEPVKVSLTIINDELCEECDTTRMLATFNDMFESLDVKRYDYETKEAQELMQEYEIKLLPAYIFDYKLIETDSWKDNPGLQTAFEKRSDGFIVLPDAVGSDHDPLKEVCDNEKDDRDEDEQVDCEDDECAFELVCNKDAFIDCAKTFDVSQDAVVFYHADYCGWCNKMKPGVEQLEQEGYKFHSIEQSETEKMQLIETCFRKHMTSGGVPQFICVKNGNIKSGAFVDAEKNLDVDIMRNWVDACVGEVEEE